MVINIPKRLLEKNETNILLRTRLPIVLLIILFWVTIIIVRLIWLQIVNHRYYSNRAKSQHLVFIPVEPIRGELRDRENIFLALSLRSESLFCTPMTFYPHCKIDDNNVVKDFGEPDTINAAIVAEKIAGMLVMPKELILEKLLKHKTFVWIKRQVPKETALAIKELKIDGLGFLPENKRQYPMGSLACQLLGFTSIDGMGQLGIEKTFDEELSGKNGELIAPRDAKGRLLILRENFSMTPVNGLTLQLTLDSTIQQIVENALIIGSKKSHPITAYAVVIDPFTGEILAMASTPSFNPNDVTSMKNGNIDSLGRVDCIISTDKQKFAREQSARKVHAIEDSYEPGSTMKVFTAAIALEEHKVHQNEIINCENGHWKYYDAVINDIHPHSFLSLEQILWYSSNIGSAKIALRVDRNIYYNYLRKFGFGELTGLNFPGETAGRLPHYTTWSATSQLTMAYGYGLSVSPLQILMASSALANGGKLMQPYIVQKIFNDKGKLVREFKPIVKRQVVSEQTALLMRDMLKGVITYGTAKLAKLDNNIEVFGKTGTTRKIFNKKYDVRRHYASFIGFFPANNPRYGILIMLDDPSIDTTGGDVAAPIFKQIGDAIMCYKPLNDKAPLELNFEHVKADWPISESDGTMLSVEFGKVPLLIGLTIRLAIHKVILAGGIPVIIESVNDNNSYATKVCDQYPLPGAKLLPKSVVKIKMGSL